MNKTFYQAFYPEGIFVVQEKSPVLLNPEEIEIVKKEITYIGENRKKILIVIHDRESDTINEKDKEFLGKILGAVKLTFNDIALVNSFLFPALHPSDLENKISYTKLILFGEELIQLFNDLKLNKYKLSEVNDVEVLYSDSLFEIQEDKTKKIKLWEELKKMFP
ncbi:MAG TPA: hypothetical protein VD908_18795 [Cytophagales bacterium]|nr:hypothetical protein [Cytophagales bacterium]